MEEYAYLKLFDIVCVGGGGGGGGEREKYDMHVEIL